MAMIHEVFERECFFVENAVLSPKCEHVIFLTREITENKRAPHISSVLWQWTIAFDSRAHGVPSMMHVLT